MSQQGSNAPPDLAQFMAAERQQESGGNYTANNGSSGASGAYQFIQSTWNSEATAAGYGQYAGRPAADAPPAVQDAVAAYNMTNLYNEFGNWTDVAKAWYAGPGFQSEDQGRGQSGGNPSIDNYAASVMSIMNSGGGAAGSSNSTLNTSGQASNSLPDPDLSTNTPASINNPGQYTNMSAVISYIQQNYPDMAWVLNQPDIANILESTVQGLLENNNTASLSESAIWEQLENTSWWKTNSSALKNYDAELATNPADYDPAQAFNVPGSVLNQNLATIKAAAAQQGVTLTTQEGQSLATQMAEFGWNTQQVQQALGAMVTIGGANPYGAMNGAGDTSNAQTIVQQLSTIAGQYAQLQSDSSLQTWAQQIAEGTQSMNSFTAAMSQAAQAQYPTLGAGLAQGQTVTQLMQSQINQVAQLLEVDPSQVETGLVTNPQYAKILNGGTAGQTTSGTSPTASNAQAAKTTSPAAGTVNATGGVPMTTAEAAQYARGLPQWQTTQNARDTGAQVTQAILQGFGASPIQ